MARSDRKRILIGAIVLLALAFILPPFINVNRYRSRIVEAASNALGRPVTIGAMSLSLLPQPGFTIENFVVGDDPAFSEEPILRAEEVRATLRMTSLWRGKLEIAKLSLKYPSLNLVRNSEGKLNLESLLSRATRTLAAPTTARKPEHRVRFPYIQADAGRINFKSGLEKKAFALGETDFALWSEAENEWRMRLIGKPLRTDTNVTDAGTLRIEGSFKRADNLRDTPLQLQFSLAYGQFGQITKLIYGRDRGWRGNAEMSGTVSGTPESLDIVADAAIQDFRRYDIARGEAIRLQTHCTGVVSAPEETVKQFQCDLPAATGSIHAAGKISSLHPAAYDLKFTADRVPMNWAAAFARHVKRDLPDDLSATGLLSADLHATKEANAPGKWTGSGTTDQIVLKSDTLGKDLAIDKIAFDFPAEAPRRPARGTRGVVVPASISPRFEFAPFPVRMGTVTPLVASGWLSGEGYSLNLDGEADLERLLQVSRVLGIGVPHFRATGSTRVAITIAGPWKGFVQPSATGTLQFRDAVAEIPGIAQPVKIASASATLSAGEIRMQNIAANVEDISLTGSAVFPRSCEQDAPCASRWDIQLDEVDPSRINALLNPRMKKRPWYRFFGGGDREQSVLARIDATGHLTAKRLVLASTTATKLSGDFALQDAKFTVTNLHAELAGGVTQSDFTADFSGSNPVYSVNGSATRLSVVQLAALTRDPWATGTITGTYALKLSGWDASDLASSAAGEAQVTLRDGAFRRIALDGRGTPLRFSDLTAKITLADGQFRIPESKLQTPSGIYQVSGTATFNRELTLQMSGASGTAYKVTGTLEKPTVVAVPAREAEASLKK